MSESNRGKVVPFGLSAYRMRKSADAYRRRGQTVEALELLRRAAVQEDSAQGWLRLAKELRMAGCHEQAAAILYRLCGWEDVLPETWLELGRNLAALERRDAACDSLYRYLHEDPYSEAADQAQDMLDEMEEDPETRVPFRRDMLVRRGLMCYRRGERALGDRRLKRAIRMGGDEIRLYAACAMIALAEDDPASAMRTVARALKHSPEDAGTLSMAAVTLSAMGKGRMARGMLDKCARQVQTSRQEDQFLTAAGTIGASAIARRYLEGRLQMQPCRISLMHPQAELLWRAGEHDMAMRWWKRILAIDPEDMRARAMVAWAPEHPEEPLPMMGALPGDFVREQLMLLPELIRTRMPPEEMLARGSRSRAALDWCFRMADENLQQTALKIASRQDAPCVRRYLHELLTSPGISQGVRQRMMMILADWGDPGPMNVLMGSQITTAQLTPVKDTERSLWQIYLPLLLQETRRTCHATQIAFFAADLWDVMSVAQRHDAAGAESYLWVKAIEILYLRLTGEEDRAARIVRNLPVSPRKISRVMRQLKKQTDMSMEGETHP